MDQACPSKRLVAGVGDAIVSGGVEAGAALAGYASAFSGLGQIRRWSQVMTPSEVLSTIDSRYLERRSPARPIAAAIPTQ